MLLRLAGLLPAIAAVAGAEQTSNLCSLVASKLPGLLFYSGNEAYNASQTSYYTSQERDLIPGCIFRPNTTADVSQFIKLVAAHGERDDAGDYKPLFAVRGGGHTLWGGAANIDGGVTVDMRALNSLVVSEDRKMASLGGGGKWSDLYPQLVPYNITVMGGRIPGIGVGGFSTGGMSQRFPGPLAPLW